ncbi:MULTISPECIES: ParA family protein [unclassified Breznakia]|uniref:ParA family protein n=1 Tax=unclassified Breznakia TaxID=2623764 RepID=UPI00247721FC|nr:MULTISPECIES: ParA family protein [unclassified Breznakia]MDH6367864.1 chromosome partitioning protein [Breznakia sp. PH1-1]MDH6404952.1 chromosome partitioning protein [Breznakia sp. PF1-11]MDH6412667.1 chromosome partitioning protein [Breznakia sp. PFB1-11]MDH6415030.1 chromosome partitioning protein [Breznakia sp. PFB1-14]MDH6417338.1 chromosome partitioning protein [Breznakia sp. PFB1-4]
MSNKQASVIAIVNRKGGVGKTTTAKNLSYELSKMKKKVLVVDMDPQCNCTKGLIPEDNTPGTILDVLNEKSIERYLLKYNKHMDIIAGDTMLASASESIENFTSAIDSVKSKYDYIIIDSSPYFNEITAMILLATELVIIPTFLEVDSLDGMTTTINEIKALRDDIDYKILFTQVNNLKSTEDDLEAIYGVFEEHSFKTLIRYHRYAPKRARAKIIPLSKRYKMASVTKDYIALAKELNAQEGF